MVIESPSLTQVIIRHSPERVHILQTCASAWLHMVSASRSNVMNVQTPYLTKLIGGITMKRVIASVLGASTIALTGFGGLAIAPASVNAEPIAKNVTLSSGNFVTVDAGHPTQGTATIIEENGQKYLQLSDSFRTASGPTVYVVFHRNSSVARSLQSQDYVTLAPLFSTSGAQRYRIPSSIDLNAFNSVAIWCERFNITFGYASI